MGAAAGADNVGVAERDLDLLERHAEEIGGDLRETCLVPLPRRLGADDDFDPSLRTIRSARSFGEPIEDST